MYNPEINLDNLHEHTEQQVFDFVVEHLRRQGEQSNLEHGCAYRGVNDNGRTLMCAAGCLIADDQYTVQMDSMDDTTWSALVDEGLVPDVHESLIRSLQVVHDSKRSSWEEGFVNIAAKYNLELKEF